jgi:hypothetical protein
MKLIQEFHSSGLTTWFFDNATHIGFHASGLTTWFFYKPRNFLLLQAQKISSSTRLKTSFFMLYSTSRLRNPFNCYIVPREIHHFPRCSYADELQLASRLPLEIYNLWKSSHLHYMHTFNMKHHRTIFNYKFSNLFYTGNHNLPNMSLLLIMSWLLQQ